MNRVKVLGVILFIGAIVTGPLAFWLAGILGNVEIFGLAGFSYLWLMFPFSLVPLASVVFGVLFNRKNRIKNKNVITGIAATLFMTIIGFYSFAIQPDRSGAFLREASSKTGIVLPQNVESASYAYFDGRIGNALIKDDLTRQTFETAIKGDKRWLDDLPAASKGILPTHLRTQLIGYDYYCLHVEPTNVYNPTILPAGEYSLTFLSYNLTKKQLTIFDHYTAVLAY